MPPDDVNVAPEDLVDVHPSRQRINLTAAAAVMVPGVVLSLTDVHWSDPLLALFFGLAIVGAAFLLSWAAEVAQLDIAAGLAIAVLALVAVLPEYAVDMVFAWKGGNAVEQYGTACKAPGAPGESDCSLALANMTGANRLLIGIGWSAVVFVAWWRWRKRGIRSDTIQLERSHAVEVSFLAVATAISFTIPLFPRLMFVHAVALVGLFALYSVRISRAPAEEPHLVGPARYIGTFRTPVRRTWVVGLFVVAATAIILCAEPFAHSLVATGRNVGISEFLLVQWLAPLASEAPELLVALLYAWRLNTNAALGTLVSSKVNQWTLLVGTLPIVFLIAAGSFGFTDGLPMDTQQKQEIFLTAAQSVFAVALLANLSISVREALWLFGLFWAQFVLGAVVPDSWHGRERVIVGVVYIVLGVFILLRDRGRLPQLLRDGFFTPYADLARAQESGERAPHR